MKIHQYCSFITIGLLLSVISIVIDGCSASGTAYPPNEILLFRFVNPELKNNIVVYIDTTANENIIGTPVVDNSNRYIATFPRMIWDKPMFLLSPDPAPIWPNYERCELSTDSVWIELHDGWFMPNPACRWGSSLVYTIFSSVALDATWDDICNEEVDLDTATILGNPYQDDMLLIYVADIAKLSNIEEEQLTMQDIVSHLNDIIDNNKLEKYAYGCGI